MTTLFVVLSFWFASITQRRHTHTHIHNPTTPHHAGFPEHMTFPEFRRRYGALQAGELTDGRLPDKESVEYILHSQEVDKSTYRIGLSQVGGGEEGDGEGRK